MGPSASPVPFLQTEFLESAAQLSPDGRWVAYTSDESGEVELFVRAFPSGERKRKISEGFARQPKWGPDGRELFFLSGTPNESTLMSVTVTSAPNGTEFEAAAPERLFDVRVNSFHPATGTRFYDVSSDGERFLFNHVDNDEEPVLNVIVNWPKAFAIPDPP